MAKRLKITINNDLNFSIDELRNFISRTISRAEIDATVEIVDETLPLKLYKFTYTDCVHESGYLTLSVHRTREGAEKAMKEHREKKEKEWLALYPDNKCDAGFDMGTYDTMQDWHIMETEILD